MKKIYKAIVSLLCVLTLSFSFAGCGSSSEDYSSKTCISVGVFDGGIGKEWLEAIIKRFENDYSDYQYGDKVGVHIDSDVDRGLVGISSLKTLPYDIIFTEQMPYYNFASSGDMLDITELLTADLSKFGDTNKIIDKLDDANKEYFKVNNKYYALPHYSGSYATYYDIDMFNKYGLYFAGDTSTDKNYAKYTLNGGEKEYEFVSQNDGEELSSGPNGIVGDYDDGLPATIEQFLSLCGKMLENGITPLTFTGTTIVYITQWLIDLAVNLVPEEESDLLWTNEGSSSSLIDYIDNDGTVHFMPTTEITTKNGYLSHRQVGRYYALALYEELINRNYCYSKTKGSYSHLEAQHSFIEGTYKSVSKNTDKIGMLIDGTFWENESSLYFDDMVNNGKGEAAKRTNRNFAIMPMPKADENSLGKNVMFDALSSVAFILSKTDESKIDLAKEFLLYCYSDKSLSEFTGITGTVVNMKYDVNSTDLAKLSTYTKSLIQLKSDSKMVYPIASNNLYVNHQATFMKTEYGWETIVNKEKFSSPVTFFRSTKLGEKKTAINYFTGVYNDFYTENYWNGIN